jgi:Protein of unknown function (DUF3617)
MSPRLRLALALSLLSSLALAGDRPAVKVGLWETTIHSEGGGGAAGIPDDPRLTPEMRARIEAMMAARGGAGGGGLPGLGKDITVKSCITDKDLDHPFEPNGEHRKCTQTIVSRTATSAEVHVECAASGPSGGTAVGTFKWQATSPESMQGSTEMTFSANGHDMTHKSTITGKWLGADCGDVKPRSPQVN